MANVKIGDLTAATAAALADLFEIEQGGATKRATLELLRAALGVPLVYTLTADEVRNNTTTPTLAGALTAPVAANTEYAFTINGAYSSATATPDLGLGAYGPAGATGEVHGGQMTAAGSQATSLGAQIQTGTFASSGVGLLFYRGRIRTAGTAGNLEIRIAQFAATVEDTKLHVGAQLHVAMVRSI